MVSFHACQLRSGHARINGVSSADGIGLTAKSVWQDKKKMKDKPEYGNKRHGKGVRAPSFPTFFVDLLLYESPQRQLWEWLCCALARAQLTFWVSVQPCPSGLQDTKNGGKEDAVKGRIKGPLWNCGTLFALHSHGPESFLLLSTDINFVL